MTYGYSEWSVNSGAKPYSQAKIVTTKIPTKITIAIAMMALENKNPRSVGICITIGMPKYSRYVFFS